MYTRFIIFITMAMVLLSTGCSSTPDKTGGFRVTGGAPVEIRGADTGDMIVGTRDQQGRKTHSDSSDTEPNGMTDQSLNAPPNPRVILFDFDSNEISPDAATILSAHGTYLTTHSQTQITLEGHADERGTREYNLALGERRASAARQFLMTQGARGEQLRVFSYGEERPANPGQNEEAWAQNRRVELVY